MPDVSFTDAFDRWHELAVEEHRRLKTKDAKTPVLSWEALDHVCGLAVEAGMKALLLHEKLVHAEHNGDYPADHRNRRPHVEELWNIFISKAQGRKYNDWTSRLAGPSSTTPANVFQTWRPEHRYAKDQTIPKNTVQDRVEFANRLKNIARELW